MFKVTIRRKPPNKKGQQYLFLDIYPVPPHRPRFETLGVYVFASYHLLTSEMPEGDNQFFGIPLLSKNIYKKVKDLVNDAGIGKKITFHCFRHTFATLQLSKDTNIATIQEMLGHSNITQTMRYAKVMDKDKKEAANKIVIPFPLHVK